MPEIDGIELARRIRHLQEDVLFIFISNKEELVFQTFEVQPFRFIRKNHFQEELESLIHAIHHHFKKIDSPSVHLTIDSSHRLYSFNPLELVYIEVIGKYCDFVFRDHKHTIRYKLSDAEKLLKNHGFIQIHRSYLVNCRYIFSIGNHSIALDSGEELSLSRNRVDQVKDFFFHFAKEEY